MKTDKPKKDYAVYDNLVDIIFEEHDPDDGWTSAGNAAEAILREFDLVRKYKIGDKE